MSLLDPSPNTISVMGFKITTQKRPILKADPIEDMTQKLGIAPPEMIFGDNYVTIEQENGHWGITFNAFDALDRVDKTGASMLKVAYSKEWQRSREKTHEGIKEVVKPFDWSYSTDYLGTIHTKSLPFEATEKPIPVELLKRPDPILFFDEVILYEDELADNGITTLSCKIRVMPKRLLLLSRFFMRLDNVLVRLRDTRVYVDFESMEVIREYQSKECDYATVRRVLAATRDDVPAVMRDPNRLSEALPLLEKRLERVDLRN
ncbi:putative TOR signaling pathway protein TipA [Aspergillus steynii IBT 23096]|uniref:Putative TOR signaling pathway protein TipA n=1 Tax=Aspergillus steynii IBT 23096 TaxID=1392250 RepID=A0A2I2G2B9_9EURO|nr:putative TOR signaling pathway protein TipA [Aspergillus steynii IBT 23096]PLB47021.1 putative TOR signaling pathway protein TipA [Aspergillus steynii IBT 23096]